MVKTLKVTVPLHWKHIQTFLDMNKNLFTQKFAHMNHNIRKDKIAVTDVHLMLAKDRETYVLENISPHLVLSM